jgi:hypothetical protein
VDGVLAGLSDSYPARVRSAGGRVASFRATRNCANTTRVGGAEGDHLAHTASKSPDTPQPLGAVIERVRAGLSAAGVDWSASGHHLRRRQAPTQFLTLRDDSQRDSATITCRPSTGCAGPSPRA